MIDWKVFSASQQTVKTGTGPSVYHYILLRLAENGLTVAIFVLVLAAGALSVTLEGESVQWARDAFKTILGVFLGFVGGKNASASKD